MSDNSLSEEASRDEQQLRSSLAFPGPAEGSGTTVISLPGSALKNIRRYRENYEDYLRTAAHEAVGSINPWAVVDRYICFFKTIFMVCFSVCFLSWMAVKGITQRLWTAPCPCSISHYLQVRYRCYIAPQFNLFCISSKKNET